MSLHSSLSRILPSLALLLPLAPACFENHVVGTDDDAGTSSPDAGGTDDCKNAVAPPCEEPNLGPGCTLGGLVCTDGQYSCPQPVCPSDAGSSVDAGGDDCAGQIDACNEPVVPLGCTLDNGGCIDGQLICPSVICPDAGSTGASFECGKAFCDAQTQYCSITQGGAIEPDGGQPSGSVTCEAIPTSCLNEIDGAQGTCNCLTQQEGGSCSVSSSGDITVTRDVP